MDQTGQAEKSSKALPVLPSSVANSQKELETHLEIAAVAKLNSSSAASTAAATPARGAVVAPGGPSTKLANDMVLPSNVSEEVSIVHNQSRSVDQTTSPMGMGQAGTIPAAAAAAATAASSVSYIHHDMPEMEQLEVELVKDSQVRSTIWEFL